MTINRWFVTKYIEFCSLKLYSVRLKLIYVDPTYYPWAGDAFSLQNILYSLYLYMNTAFKVHFDKEFKEYA